MLAINKTPKLIHGWQQNVLKKHLKGLFQPKQKLFIHWTSPLYCLNKVKLFPSGSN